MSHPVIRLFDAAAPSFRFDLAPGAATARPLSTIADEIRSHAAAGASWIVLEPPEPAAHPELAGVLAAAQEAGLRCKMSTTGQGLAERGVLEGLRDAGLAQLTLLFWGGVAATHDARLGAAGAFEGALAALEEGSRLNRLMTTVRMVLLADNHGEVAPLVERVRERANRFELVRLSSLVEDPALLREHGVGRRHALAAVQAGWEAARVGALRFTTEAFGTWPDPPVPTDATLQPADGSLLDLLRAHVPVPSVANGTWATPRDGDLNGIYLAVEESRDLTELGLQLAAYGCPALDLPPSLGGLGLDVTPEQAADGQEHVPLRRRNGVPALLAGAFDADTRDLPHWSGPGAGASVHIVDGLVTDNILALSTLPALASCLEREGARVRLHTVWHAPVNPYDPGVPLPDGSLAPDAEGRWRFPAEVVDSLATIPARYAHARRQAAAVLEGLDLSGADLVVVPGFDNALRVLDNSSLPATARVVVPDYHLLTGLSAWHARWLADGPSMAGGWWPDERILVHALYPRYVRSYWRAGVPLRQVHWRPYPVHDGHFPPGPPPEHCTALFAGGTHQRDWSTLARAWSQLGGRTRPLVLHTPDRVPPPLRSAGEARLLHFYEAIANSRFVVLPLDPDPRKPAGISVISLALAAGRPVIASATLATIDHLRHGHDAILVPPGRPAALAQAIERLDQDDALLTRLAAGARASAATASVASWARDLLHGAPARTVWSTDDAPRGPFRSWPC